MGPASLRAPAQGGIRGRFLRRINWFQPLHACNVALAAALLAGCAAVPTQDQLARETARNVIRPILADRFPGVPLEPLTDCVIDNASAAELFGLAQTGLTGLTPDAFTTILAIAQRPGTLQCLASDGVAGLTRQGAL